MRVAIVLVSVLLLAPTGLAASLHADLRFDDAPRLAGDAVVHARHGAWELDLSTPLRIEFASAEGWIVTQRLEYAGAPGGPEAFVGGSVSNASVALEAGALVDAACGAGCRGLLIADGAGTLAFSGTAAGLLAPLGESRVVAFGNAEAPEENGFLYKMGAPWLAAGAGGLHLVAPTARGDGALTLFLSDTSILAEQPDGARRLDARRTSEPTPGPLGVSTGRSDDARFLLLHLHGARVEVAAGDGTLFAPAPSVALEGRLSSLRASGVVTVDGERHALTDASFSATGALDASPVGDVAGLAPLGASAVEASVTGTADEVVLGGAPVARVWQASGATAAAALSLAAILAALAGWKTGAFAWLYTRLEPATLLRNPNRRRVHEAVQQRPGATVADLVRALDMTEVVVRHHLRMLEAHGFVVARGEGKHRGFHPPGRVDVERADVYLSLRDATRRRIAWAVADAPAPLSQQELAATVGVSPRLVSYHLGRLEKDGLVTGEGSMPRRYEPCERLVQFRELDAEASAA